MALLRLNTWQDLGNLQNQINRLLDVDILPSAFVEGGLHKLPAAELLETSDAIVLKLELPGIEAKDLDIQVTQDSVSISGERKSEIKTEAKGVFKSEFHYGKFQRVIPLPAQIQNTKVTAEYKDGILHLTLPKADAEKHKVVKVNLTANA